MGRFLERRMRSANRLAVEVHEALPGAERCTVEAR